MALQRSSLLLIIGFALLAIGNARPQWTIEQANQWQAQHGWMIGCNFIPSNAVNTLEMWQNETFDPATIDRELGYARNLGFNIVRVFTHYLTWQQNAQAFKQRLSQFLQIADSHKIKVMFTLFDDCWNPEGHLGPQPAPVPGVHNSQWVQVPGEAEYTNTSMFSIFKGYVTDIIETFKNDQRVVVWDIYNEPGNSNHGTKTLPLLLQVFQWARSADPSQPITSGVWNFSPAFNIINAYQLNSSDIISFHSYEKVDTALGRIQTLKTQYKRPIVCTEYMARTMNSTFATHVPMFAQQNVSCINWGLVSGKTQTIYPWGSKPNSPPPPVWFHDILYPNGTGWSNVEVQFLQNFTKNRTLIDDFIYLEE